MTQKTYKFKKGDRPHLDQVYRIMSLIPAHAYHQDDIGDSNHVNDNDGGESVLFLKNVTIKINVQVT